MGYKKLSNEQEKQLVNDYLDGISVKVLMEKYGFKTKKSITDKVKKYYPDNYKEKIQEAKINRKGYYYTLEKIQCEFDAYYLGLLLTDGYISRGTDVGLDLVDQDCIEFLSRVIGKEYKTYSENNNHKQKHRLILSDINLVNNLKRFGVVERKTLALQGPQLLPEEKPFLPYIIRGIIDGDGTVSPTSYGGAQFHIVTMSEDFANWLKTTLEQELFMVDIKKSQSQNGLWTIETANQYNILKLIALVYNKPYGMMRKYKLLRKTFRDYNNDPLLEGDGIVQTTTD